ncbi:uncharacterized protein LOC112081501 [Eutrema salsugineum]|uniref:uncharacterized protein LOC112081501 n=1 Tax=Eutrema salsugineum TaxID=72664 RepID=UPI000CECE65C|nr:uncharacterized protein LOC112081501 [Eutrema salsugineum]
MAQAHRSGLEKWVFDEHPRRPVNKEIFMDLELRVSDLISEEGKWMENKVHELFPPNNAAKIWDMSIGRVPDKHIWAYTYDGAFSVKSGYWLLANHPRLPQPPVSLVLSGAVAVADRYLWIQGAARAVWDLSRLHLPSNGFSNSLEVNMSAVLDWLDDQNIIEEIRIMIPWILWWIWKNRNAIIFSGNQDSSARIIQVANDEAKAWKEANNLIDTEDALERNSSVLSGKWQPPPSGKLKDAFTKAPNRNIAELKGVIWAIKSLRDLRLENVVLALDCRKAFTAIMNPANWPRYRMLTDQIYRLQQGCGIAGFELETAQADQAVQAIAKSVTRDGRLQSVHWWSGLVARKIAT